MARPDPPVASFPVMDLRPAAVVERFRGKALRYITTSIIGTVLTQVQLLYYVNALEWNSGWANVVAVSLTCIPGYLITKYWVWQSRDSAAIHKEALAFWGMNLAGLALSTLFVVIAAAISDAPILVNLANLAGFGVLWVAKFLLLDEHVFKAEAPLVEV
jgi:putative flippase GtrA